MRKDEEHSAWTVVFHDSTNAERQIGIAAGGAAGVQAASARWRARSRKFNEPPFVVVKNEHRDSQPNWIELLDYVKNEGKKDARCSATRVWAR